MGVWAQNFFPKKTTKQWKVELTVQTAKRLLEKSHICGNNHNTPSQSLNTSPAQTLLNTKDR